MMLNLIGSRTISKQESCHLSLGTAMVSCSHQFVKISLTTSFKKITLKKRANYDPDEDLEKPSILEMYMKRMKSEIWESTYEFETYNHQFEFSSMNLYEFAKTFYVRNKNGKEKRHLMNKHIKENLVIMFTPVLSADPAGDNYHEFCRLSLIKYRPFVDSVENAYNTLSEKKDIIKCWEDFSKDLLNSGRVVPGNLRRDFERVAKYNEKNNKENKEKEKSNYFEDFEVPEDRVVNNREVDDVVLQNNLMMSGNVCTDYDALQEIRIRWDRDFDFSEKVQTYADGTDFKEIGDDFTKFLETRISRRVVRRNLSRDTLKPSQQLAHDVVVRMATREPGTSKTDDTNSEENGRLCILCGKGGAGKSYTVDCVLSTLKNQYNFREENYLILATSAMAATVISGATVHSPDHGLGIPTGNRYVELKGNELKKYQTRLKYLKLLIIDEFSMLGQKELFFVSERLKQIKSNTDIFGGVCVILIGDPAQLPPVQGNALWIDNTTSRNQATKNGSLLYTSFDECLFLKENNRLDENDPQSVQFNRILNKIRDGKITDEDCEIIRNTCSRCRMGATSFRDKGFENDGITHLYSTNEEANKFNDSELLKLQKGINQRKIARITAENSDGARSFDSTYARKLANELFLCVDAKVMLLHNLKQESNLVNGSMGYVKEIVYEDGQGPPSLPLYVLVDFGEFYTGVNFFEKDSPEKKNWVPIKPTTMEWWGFSGKDKNTYTRRQLPLRLAWAITIHKSQGITIDGKYCIDLGKKEMNHGMTYVAFSRARKFSNIGLISPLTGTRVNSIDKNKGNQIRMEHEKHLEEMSLRTENTFKKLVC